MAKDTEKAKAQGFARGLKGKSGAANVVQGWGDDKESSEARNEGFALGNRKRVNEAAKKARANR
jgi:hypothetical protein